MKILFENKTSYNIHEYKKIIILVIKKIIEKEKFNSNFELSISFVTNKEIKIINKKFRNLNKDTDVLSFPYINFDLGETIPKKEKYLLGDIIISIEKAFSQAENYGHSIKREICFLIIHSMLHLLGYDHINLEDEKIMFKKQNIILKELNIKR